MRDIVERLRGYNPPDRTVDEQRQIAQDISDAADEIERLRAALEIERMRVSVCGVVAMADTPESAAGARDMHPSYHSASCDAVARRVDECIRLRAENAELRDDAELYRWIRDVPISVDTVADPDNLVQVRVGTIMPRCFRGRTLKEAIGAARGAQPTTPDAP